MTELETTDAVIDFLDGTTAVSRLLGTSPQAVHAYRTRVRGFFPPDTFDVLRAALTAKSATAPKRLWRMREAHSAPTDLPQVVSPAGA